MVVRNQADPPMSALLSRKQYANGLVIISVHDAYPPKKARCRQLATEYLTVTDNGRSRPR